MFCCTISELLNLLLYYSWCCCWCDPFSLNEQSNDELFHPSIHPFTNVLHYALHYGSDTNLCCIIWPLSTTHELSLCLRRSVVGWLFGWSFLSLFLCPPDWPSSPLLYCIRLWFLLRNRSSQFVSEFICVFVLLSTTSSHWTLWTLLCVVLCVFWTPSMAPTHRPSIYFTMHCEVR